MNTRSLTPLTTPTGQLDPPSVEYLRAVEKGGANAPPGVLVQRSWNRPRGPRGGWWFLLFVGVAMLGALGWVFHAYAAESPPGQLLPWQVGLVGAGTLFFLFGVMRYRRPKPKWLPGSFLFADANYLWDVTPNEVSATPLPDLVGVDGTHYSENGSYTYTSVELQFYKGQRRYWQLHTKQKSEKLLGFLQYLIAFRTSELDHVREWADGSPGRLAAAALQFVERSGAASIGDIPEMDSPPDPHPVPPDPSSPRYGWGGAFASLVVAVGVAAGGYYGFPIVNDQLHENYLFTRIPPGDNGYQQPLTHYLAVYPNGPRAAKVREMLDDRRFAQAEVEAKTHDSPSSLRGYLADASNTRHRDAARKLIGGFYDSAIEALKKKRAAEPAKTDKDLFDGIVALLEALKQADRPIVTVGFKSTHQRSPVTPEQKSLEKLMYEILVKKEPQLNGIAERSPTKSAIIEPGDAFADDARAKREAVILERLRTAVQKGINADILTLEPVAEGEAPMMEVAYDVLADGKLGTYRDTNKQLAGLLRWYAIGWTITTRPPGTQKVFMYKLKSEPGNKLTYDSEPSDPSWGIYAVLLYSGFYDMSARLITNFGLDPGAAPNAFSFAAAMRTATDEPATKPGDPLPFQWRPQPGWKPQGWQPPPAWKPPTTPVYKPKLKQGWQPPPTPPVGKPRTKQ